MIISTALFFSTALAYYKYGKITLSVLLPLAAYVFLFNSTADVIALVFVPFAVGSLCGFVFKNNKSMQFYIVVATVIVTSILLANYYYQLLYLKKDVLGMAKEMFSGLPYFKEGSPEDQANFNRVLEQTYDTFKVVYPFIFFINAFFWSMAGFAVNKIVVQFYTKTKITLKGIEFFKLSDYLIFMVITATAIVFFAKDYIPYKAYYVFTNVLLITIFFYFIQSIGIAKFFIKMKKLPFSIIPFTILLALFFGVTVFSFFMIIMTGFGILDLWADFRKLNIDGSVKTMPDKSK